MEIEIRAFVDNLESIEKKLKLMKVKKTEITQIKDIWYGPKDASSYEDVKMDHVGSYGLRLRQEKDKPAELNVKAIITHGDHNVFDEAETNINNIDQMKTILKLIGLKPFCVLEKKRTTYSLDNMKINLEDIKGFEPCIEIEILADEDFDKHKEKIHKMIEKLGIKNKDIIEKSITLLFMKKYGFKQKIEE